VTVTERVDVGVPVAVSVTDGVTVGEGGVPVGETVIDGDSDTV
jgi:hypothetical protein